ncbi:hypothetical protein GCM10027605_11470 [Micromonospora zhanjiangensis]
MKNDVDPVVPTAEVGGLARAVLDAVGSVLVGKRDALELVLAGILAGGHVLLEDLPGLGKTLTARSFAQALGLDFRRLQFTPDLLPADVTGSFLYDQRSADFTFRAGPLFTNLLLADEINRTPPKTQAALLEAMQEKQVSVEGVTYRLDPPFHVLATANPIEYEGTYPLPEAQLDRFLLRVSFGYPNRDEEWDVLRRRMSRRREETELEPVVNAATLRGMQAALEDVAVEDSIGRYIVDLTAATREHPSVLVGASPGVRWRCCCCPGPRPCWPAGTTWSPRTSRTWRCRCCRTGSPCGRRCGCAGSTRRSWSTRCSTGRPRRPAERCPATPVAGAPIEPLPACRPAGRPGW